MAQSEKEHLSSWMEGELHVEFRDVEVMKFEKQKCKKSFKDKNCEGKNIEKGGRGGNREGD